MRPETSSRVIFQACMEIVHHENPKRLIKCKKYLQAFRDQMEREYKADGYDFCEKNDDWRSSFHPSFNELYYISDRWRAPHRICYDFATSTLWNYRKVFREDFMNANLNTYDRVYWATGSKPTMAEFQKMSIAPCFKYTFFEETI